MNGGRSHRGKEGFCPAATLYKERARTRVAKSVPGHGGGLLMAEDIDKIKYRNHIITAMPVRNPDGGGWIARFRAWKYEAGKTLEKVVKDQESHVCKDKGEAIKRSISMGKFWVDREEGPP